MFTSSSRDACAVKTRRTSQGILALLCLLLTAGCAFVVCQMYQAAGAGPFFRATDFRAFYTAGQIVAAGRGTQLYDLQEQYSWQAAAVGLDAFEQLLAYFNPPFAALPFALLSHLRLQQAYGAWTIFNLTLYALIGVLIADLLRGARVTVRMAAITMSLMFLPAIVTVIQGQWSLLLTAALLLGWRALRDGRDLQAGLWLGILIVKPQLILLPVVALLWQRRWRAVGGLMIGCGVAVGLSVAVSGGSGLVAYINLLTAAAQWGDRFGIHPQAMYTLRGLAHALLGTNDPLQTLPYWFAGIALTIGLVWWNWRQSRKPPHRSLALHWATLLIAMLLVSPHVYSHDLSLLIVAGTLAVSALIETPAPHLGRGRFIALTPAGYLLLSLILLLDMPWRVYAVVTFLSLAFTILATRIQGAGNPASHNPNSR